MPDSVDHPSHYTSNLSGIETIEITEEMGFNLGNAIKYISRAGKKWDRDEDLKKAIWYISRECSRVSENTSEIRQLSPKEIRYVEGSGTSDRLKISLILILQSSIGGAINGPALRESIRLIEEDLSDD